MHASTRASFVVSLLAVSVFGSAYAAGAESATLAFESEMLSLATGQIHQNSPRDDGEADVRIAYNADRSARAVVVPAREGVEIAVLAGTTYESADATAVAGASFSAEGVDAPFGAGDTVLLRTPEGAVFKLGHPSESATALSFDYEPVP
jgi:hypothetical protein